MSELDDLDECCDQMSFIGNPGFKKSRQGGTGSEFVKRLSNKPKWKRQLRAQKKKAIPPRDRSE